MKSAYQIVLCTCPDISTAKELAEKAISAKLAACVNIIPNIQSIYRWQDTIENSTEYLLLFKTQNKQYATLEKMLQNAHPYDTPEIIAIPIEQGLPKYLTWMDESFR